MSVTLDTVTHNKILSVLMSNIIRRTAAKSPIHKDAIATRSLVLDTDKANTLEGLLEVRNHYKQQQNPKDKLKRVETYESIKKQKQNLEIITDYLKKTTQFQGPADHDSNLHKRLEELEANVKNNEKLTQELTKRLSGPKKQLQQVETRIYTLLAEARGGTSGASGSVAVPNLDDLRISKTNYVDSDLVNKKLDLQDEILKVEDRMLAESEAKHLKQSGFTDPTKLAKLKELNRGLEETYRVYFLVNKKLATLDSESSAAKKLEGKKRSLVEMVSHLTANKTKLKNSIPGFSRGGELASIQKTSDLKSKNFALSDWVEDLKNPTRLESRLDSEIQSSKDELRKLQGWLSKKTGEPTRDEMEKKQFLTSRMQKLNQVKEQFFGPSGEQNIAKELEKRSNELAQNTEELEASIAIVSSNSLTPEEKIRYQKLKEEYSAIKDQVATPDFTKSVRVYYKPTTNSKTRMYGIRDIEPLNVGEKESTNNVPLVKDVIEPDLRKYRLLKKTCDSLYKEMKSSTYQALFGKEKTQTIKERELEYRQELLELNDLEDKIQDNLRAITSSPSHVFFDLETVQFIRTKNPVEYSTVTEDKRPGRYEQELITMIASTESESKTKKRMQSEGIYDSEDWKNLVKTLPQADSTDVDSLEEILKQITPEKQQELVQTNLILKNWNQAVDKVFVGMDTSTVELRKLLKSLKPSQRALIETRDDLDRALSSKLERLKSPDDPSTIEDFLYDRNLNEYIAGTNYLKSLADSWDLDKLNDSQKRSLLLDFNRVMSDLRNNIKRQIIRQNLNPFDTDDLEESQEKTRASLMKKLIANAEKQLKELSSRTIEQESSIFQSPAANAYYSQKLKELENVPIPPTLGSTGAKIFNKIKQDLEVKLINKFENGRNIGDALNSQTLKVSKEANSVERAALGLFDKLIADAVKRLKIEYNKAETLIKGADEKKTPDVKKRGRPKADMEITEQDLEELPLDADTKTSLLAEKAEKELETGSEESYDFSDFEQPATQTQVLEDTSEVEIPFKKFSIEEQAVLADYLEQAQDYLESYYAVNKQELNTQEKLDQFLESYTRQFLNSKMKNSQDSGYNLDDFTDEATKSEYRSSRRQRIVHSTLDSIKKTLSSTQAQPQALSYDLLRLKDHLNIEQLNHVITQMTIRYARQTNKSVDESVGELNQHLSAKGLTINSQYIKSKL